MQIVLIYKKFTFEKIIKSQIYYFCFKLLKKLLIFKNMLKISDSNFLFKKKFK